MFFILPEDVYPYLRSSYAEPCSSCQHEIRAVHGSPSRILNVFPHHFAHFGLDREQHHRDRCGKPGKHMEVLFGVWRVGGNGMSEILNVYIIHQTTGFL